jgi:hypothetical protein
MAENRWEEIAANFISQSRQEKQIKENCLSKYRLSASIRPSSTVRSYFLPKLSKTNFFVEQYQSRSSGQGQVG